MEENPRDAPGAHSRKAVAPVFLMAQKPILGTGGEGGGGRKGIRAKK